MGKAGSLLLRAAAAVLLMLAFYALAFAEAAGLGWCAWGLARVTADGRLGLAAFFTAGAALACGGAGLLILWSVLPRRSRFDPPGPELTPAGQPALFAEVLETAARAGQQPPERVYLAPGVNAFVARAGGLMGLGGCRVMAVGLPLLEALTVEELRGVISHELGHFFGGDTRLGPWVYATRGALGRTLQSLGAAGRPAGLRTARLVLALAIAPFAGLGALIMRTTEAISRGQELSADALAVRTVGAAAVVEGLKKVHRAGLAFGPYFEQEVAPLLRLGRLPPLAAGFGAYLEVEPLSAALAEATSEALASGEADPYDSHPPLRERIARAEALGGRTGRAGSAGGGRPAIGLLSGVERLEAALATRWVDGPLQPLSWEESAAAFAPSWRQAREECAWLLPGATVGALPRERGTLALLAERATGRPVAAPEENVRGFAAGLIGSALGALLLEAGFTARSLPGRPVRFTRGEVTFEPHPLLFRYLDGALPAREWRAHWAALGLDGAPLGKAPQAPA